MAFNNLSVGTLNCWGLNQLIKAKRISSFLKKSDFDIVCLQETYLKEGKLLQQASTFYPLQYMSPGTSKSRGVAVLISDKVNFVPNGVETDQEGHYVFVKGTFNSEALTIASVYIPNSGQVGFFKEILTKLKTFQEGVLVMGIDLNFVVDKWIDIKRPYQSHRNKNVLASKIKQRRSRNFISKIHNKQGELKYESSQILNVFSEFYLQLYSSTNPKQSDIDSFFEKYSFQVKLEDTHASGAGGTHNVRRDFTGNSTLKDAQITRSRWIYFQLL